MRGRFSVMPPPVMCARPFTSPASSSGRTTGRYDRCTRSSSSPMVHPSSSTTRVGGEAEAARRRWRGRGSSRWCAGPSSAARAGRRRGASAAPVIRRSRSTTPTMNPAMSYSPFRVEARHLGGLAADEGAPVLEAGRRDALHHLRRHVGRETARGEVVEEEQRLGALHEDVVDAVVDEALPHRVVAPGHERHLQLRADAVRARDEHRVAVVRAEAEQAAERADRREHARRERALRQSLDAVDGLVAGVDVDAGCSVVHGSTHNRGTAITVVSSQ